MTYTYDVNKPATPQIALEHAGVKGMKWGVRKKTGSTSSSSAAPRFTTNQKRAAFAVASVGASIAASMVAGPIGGMAVSGLSRIVSTTVESRNSADSLRNMGGEFPFKSNQSGDVVPNPDYKR